MDSSPSYWGGGGRGLNFLPNGSKVVLFLWKLLLIFVFHICHCHTVLSVPNSLKAACWERADLMALLFIICLLVCFAALCPKSTAVVIAGRSVHQTTLFPGQA